MRSASRLLPITVVVNGIAIVALFIAHLALVDIRHGETDVHQEWAALQVCLGVVLISQVLALVTLWRASRDRTGRGPDTVAV